MPSWPNNHAHLLKHFHKNIHAYICRGLCEWLLRLVGLITHAYKCTKNRSGAFGTKTIVFHYDKDFTVLVGVVDFFRRVQVRSTVQQASVSSAAAQTGSTPDTDCLVRYSVHCRRLKRAYRRRQIAEK